MQRLVEVQPGDENDKASVCTRELGLYAAVTLPVAPSTSRYTWPPDHSTWWISASVCVPANAWSWASYWAVFGALLTVGVASSPVDAEAIVGTAIATASPSATPSEVNRRDLLVMFIVFSPGG